MKVMGVWILCAAALIGSYALFFFDTSVATGFGRVHNLGLMADRQNLLIAACACAVVGVIMAVAGPQSQQGPDAGANSQNSATESPFVREMVEALAQDDARAVAYLLDTNRMDATDELQDGRGLLQHAVTVHALRSIRVLRQAGASPTRRDSAGNTAIEMALGERENQPALLAALGEAA